MSTRRILENVVYQHAENSCSLWWQWQLALQQPHYRFNDLRKLEKQIDANLDGLLIAGNAALSLLQELIDAEDEGAIFSTAMQFLRKGDQTRFMEFLERSVTTRQGMTELAAALAWTPLLQLQDIAGTLLGSTSSQQLQLGLSACLAHHRDPGDCLREMLSHEDSTSRTLAWRYAANLGDVSLLQQLPSRQPVDTLEQFEQARARLFLGEHQQGLDLLETIALNGGSAAASATRLLLLGAEPARARAVLRQLDSDTDRTRDVVQGFGLLGDSRAIGWLIQRCSEAATARLAGESIGLITGVNLSEENLELDAPPEMAAETPNDDPTDNDVLLSDDENLAWPDAERLAEWWHSNQSRFAPGTRHICGYERSPESLQLVLQQGWQRQRGTAADLIMINQKNTRYCNTQLPCRRQMAFMSGVVV